MDKGGITRAPGAPRGTCLRAARIRSKGDGAVPSARCLTGSLRLHRQQARRSGGGAATGQTAACGSGPEPVQSSPVPPLACGVGPRGEWPLVTSRKTVTFDARPCELWLAQPRMARVLPRLCKLAHRRANELRPSTTPAITCMVHGYYATALAVGPPHVSYIGFAAGLLRCACRVREPRGPQIGRPRCALWLRRQVTPPRGCGVWFIFMAWWLGREPLAPATSDTRPVQYSTGRHLPRICAQ